MRLINTSSFELETFNDFRTRPRYAILSHTWAPSGEAAFEDYQLSKVREGSPGSRDILAEFLRGSDTAQSRTLRSSSSAGYEKIRNACRHARFMAHDYIWIDTCCIDKRSSAELSEAINSMWQWYRGSKVCFAYLADVPYSDADHWSKFHENDRGIFQEHERDAYDRFICSRWFT